MMFKKIINEETSRISYYIDGHRVKHKDYQLLYNLINWNSYNSSMTYYITDYKRVEQFHAEIV